MKKILSVSLSLATAIAISACSDDSSTSAADDMQPVATSSDATILPPASSETLLQSSESAIPVSSADIGDLAASSASVDPALSSATVVQPVIEDEPCVGDPLVTEVPLDSQGFADIGDVYNSIRCDQKVVFVVRHGERNSQESERETPLTEDGVAQAISVGQKLTGNGHFVFTHTNYVRTEQTCFNIAQGRGQLDFPHDTNDVFEASWYVKDAAKRDEYRTETEYSSNKLLSAWAFLGEYADAYYDLAERSEEMVNTYLLKPYDQMNRFRIVCSHDEFIMPLSTYLTNGAINYRIYDMTITPPPRWVEYISGFAIVVDSTGARTVYPVKGLETGLR